MVSLRWHVLKTSLLYNAVTCAVYLVLVGALFELAATMPGPLAPLAAGLAGVGTAVLDLAGELGTLARRPPDIRAAETGRAALAGDLHTAAILLGVIFGALHEALFPGFLRLTTRALNKDERTARQIRRDGLVVAHRLRTSLTQLLIVLYFLYLSDIGSKLGTAADSHGIGISGALLLACLVTYLLSAALFSGIAGLVYSLRGEGATQRVF